MNKTLGIGVVAALLVLVGGFFLFRGGSNTDSLTQPATEEREEEDGNALDGAEAVVDGSYTVIPEESQVNWEGRKTLIADYKDNGTLKIQEGTVVVKDGKVTEGKIVFDMNTIAVARTGKNVGEAGLEKHLKSKDFFAVEEFPTASFVVKEAVRENIDEDQFRYALRGDLTIKGITHEVAIPTLAYMEDGKLYAEAMTEIDRTKWDIRFGSDKFFDNLANNVIDDNFTLSFMLVAEEK